MASRAEFDDEAVEDVNDGFHDDNPHSETYGEERVIDQVILGEEYEDTLAREERRLLDSGDKFSKLEVSESMAKRFIGSGGAASKHINPEEVDGYDFYGLARPPYNLEYLAELAVENATHAACIQTKVINIVGLGYHWKETSKIKAARLDSAEDDDKMQKLARKLDRTTAALDDWLESLNEEDDFVDILMKVWSDVEATGNGYIEIGRNRDGSIGYMGHIPAATVRVRLARDGFFQLIDRPDKMIFFRNFGDKSTNDPLGRERNPNEIIHIKKHTPKSAYYGVPDIVAALPAVAGEKFAAAYNLDYFENKAVPRYALIVKGARLSTQSERRILEYFRREVKGKHHTTLYIPVPAPMGSNVDVKLEPLENKVQDASFSKYHEQNRADIMMVHRTPSSKIAVDGANSAGARESDKTFKIQVCRPEQRRLEKKVNRIIKERTDMFTLKFEEYDLIDEETQSRIHDRYIRLGVMNANEIRAEKGMPPRKGGDKYLDLAAESESKINLQDAQAKGAVIRSESTGGTSGPPRKTTDGKTSTGTGSTPKDQSSQGRSTKGSRMDSEGPKVRER